MKPYKAIFISNGFIKFKKVFENYTFIHKEKDKVVFNGNTSKEYRDIYKVVDVICFPQTNSILYLLESNGVFRDEEYRKYV